MVSEAAERHSRNVSAGQRVAHFEIILTAANLCYVTPRRGWIRPERVVHPLADLMARGGNISVEESGGVPGSHGISLQRPRAAGTKKRVVVSGHTAIPKPTRTHDYAVKKED